MLRRPFFGLAARRFPALTSRPSDEFRTLPTAELHQRVDRVRRGLEPFAHMHPLIYDLWTGAGGGRPPARVPYGLTALELEAAEQLILALAEEAVDGITLPYTVLKLANRLQRVLHTRQTDREPSPDWEEDDHQEDADPDEIAAEEAQWQHGTPQRAYWRSARDAAYDAYEAALAARGVKRRLGTICELDGRRVAYPAMGDPRYPHPYYVDTGAVVPLPPHNPPDTPTRIGGATYRWSTVEQRLRQHGGYFLRYPRYYGGND